MPCYSPLKGYRAKVVNRSGKRGIVFNVKDGYYDQPVVVPCGQCIGCRIKRISDWTARLCHESTFHDEKCFITLTYNADNLPPGRTLVKKDFQDFIKRVRERFHPKKIRFFHCGEYGEKYSRPHYHAIIYGHDFRRDVNDSLSNSRIHCSLDSLWNKGITHVGDVTPDSCRYVASYVLKKLSGKKAVQQYPETGINKETGEIMSVLPEYVTMSRRPGIAKNWIDKYRKECYDNDSVVISGRERLPPKYYDKQLEKFDERIHRLIKLERKERLKEVPDRVLRNREKNVSARQTMRERCYENGNADI